MSRLNSRQKRAAKVRLAIHDLAVDRNPSMVAQSGKIGSSLAPRVHLSAYQAPREQADMTVEGFIAPARKGKIVRGKFVASKPTKSRFAQS